LQNMIFLESVVEDVHKLTRDLYKVSKGDEEPTKKDVEDWLAMAKDASDAINQRIFVIMTAQSQGWGFARDLEFYKQGLLNGNYC